MKVKPTAKVVLLLLLCSLLVSMAMCKKMAAPGEQALAAKDASSLRALAYGGSPSAPAPAPEEAEAPGSPAASAIPERMLIEKVTLTVEVKELKGEVRKAEAIAKSFGGYISGSQIYSEEGNQSATLTLMIPIKNLDAAVEKIRELGKVHYEQKTTEDVTRQFIDNAARIKNLSREEEALAELLKRTGKLADILEVERELARVRTEIDQIQGEQRYLQHESSFSTVTLNLTTRPEPPAYQGSPLKVAFFNAWHSFLNALHSLVVVGFYALFYVPLLLVLFLVVFLIIKLLIRIVRGKKTA